MDNADTFMALVPPTGWGDVPNRQDFDALRTDLRNDQQVFQINVRNEFDAFKIDVHNEFDAFKADMLHGLESSELRIRSDMGDRFRSQTAMLMTFFVTVMGLFVVLNQILG